MRDRAKARVAAADRRGRFFSRRVVRYRQNWYEFAFLNDLPSQNIRLPYDDYLGKRWVFVTMCCANRRKLFVTTEFCEWFLDILRESTSSHSFGVHAYCLMPDHVHLLLEGLEPVSDLLQLMRAIKIKTSTPYERQTGRPLWQKKFYDHILRRNDSPDGVAWYICMNPVRAGLCSRPEEYRFLGSLTGAWPKTLCPFVEWLPPWRKTKAPPKVRGRYRSPN